MSALAGINRFIGLFVGCFSHLSTGRIWLWLGGYFLVQALLLFAYYDFTSPLFFGPVTAWTSLFGDQAAVGFTHYPGQFRLMPYFFGWTKFYFAVIAEGFVLGMVALHISRQLYEEEEENGRQKPSRFKTWLRLTFGWLSINGLIILASTFLPRILGSMIEGHPRRELLFQLVLMPGLFVLIMALFLFVIPMLVIYRIGFRAAVGESIRLALRYPFNTLFMSALILAGPIMVSFLTSRPWVIVDRFRPEMIFWLLIGGLLIEAIANFFWIGSSVRFLAEEDS